MYKSKKPYFYGTGRRKSSVARVHLFPNGTGSITINGRDIDNYFGLETLKLLVRQPLVTTEQLGKVDIVATVTGGGVTGQAGAIRHGVARALLLANEEFRPALKAAGFLTRDPRMKERKKYGLKAARRAPQITTRRRLLLWNLQTPGITRFPGFLAFSAYFTCFHAIQAADKENHRQFGGDFLTREEYQLIHICTRRPFHTINIHGDRHGLSEFFLTFT